MSFGGTTYSEALDGQRLRGQLAVVKALLCRDLGRYWSLREIANATGFPEASISARIRDLRKRRFGAFQVVSRRRSVSQWEYAVVGTAVDSPTNDHP